MLVLIGYGSRGLCALNAFNHMLDLYRKTGNVDQDSSELSTAINQFQMDRLLLGAKGVNCSIDNYINEELYRRIAKADYNEFVPNALTGIGILGTFIGLTYGLNDFNTQSAEAMTNSMMPLISGIKIAFYTSILGVLLSVYYSFILKCLFKNANELIYKSDDTSTQENGQTVSEAQMMNALLAAQKDQLRVLKNLPEQLSDILAQKLSASITQVGNTIVEGLESIEESLDDNVENMENAFMNELSSLDTKLTQHVEQMEVHVIEKMTQIQSDGVEKMITSFVDKMTQLTGDEFSKLKLGTEAILSWQEKISQQLSVWTPDVTQSIEKLSNLHVILNNNLNDMKSLANELSEERSALSEQAVAYFSSFRDLNEITIATAASIGSMMDTVHSVSEERITALSNSLQTIADSNEKRVTGIFESISDEMVQAQTEQSERYAKFIEQTQKSMNKIENSLLQTNREMTEQTALKVSSLVDHLNTLVESMSSVSMVLTTSCDALNTASDSLSDVNKNTLATCESTRLKFESTTQKFMDSSQLFMEDLVQFKSIISGLSTNMDEMSKNMKSVSSSLDQSSLHFSQTIQSACENAKQNIIRLTSAVQSSAAGRSLDINK